MGGTPPESRPEARAGGGGRDRSSAAGSSSPMRWFSRLGHRRLGFALLGPILLGSMVSGQGIERPSPSPVRGAPRPPSDAARLRRPSERSGARLSGSASPVAKAPAAGFDARARAAVRRGLAYLARHQNDDGSWTDRVGRKVYTSYRGERNPHVGVTALAGIAFLAGGTLADQGPGIYVDRRGNPIPGSRVVSRALEYIVRQTSPTGFITAHGSRMYSHAFAALFLAEAYGMGIAPGGGRVRDCLRRAVRTIVNAQNDEGGWRYRPQADDSDMSITVCQVMALRAARNAGVRVPRETIDAAVRYVRGSFIPEIGAFTYQISNFRDFRRTPSRHSFALTAAGVATMYGAGEYASLDVIRPALRYLWRERPSRAEARYHFDYYYAQYYAVQALFQRGGAEWRRWYEGYIKPDLLALQEPEGCWSDLVGPNYATAMAAIILQFPNQYLPITEN